MRASTRWVAAGLVLVCGCRPGPSPSVSDAAPRAEAASAADVREQDLGTGIVALSRSPGGPGSRADTLPIRQAPNSTSRLRAEFVFRQDGPNAWSYAVLSGTPGLAGNLVEFAYEESGLPLDSIRPGWARVIYARNAAGKLQSGWVALDERVRHVPWKDHLAKQNLYLRSPEAQDLHSAPGGQPLPIPLTPGEYELVPVKVQGDWMQVRVKAPPLCAGGTAGEADERTAWIRYLDERGRPRVWYHPRGC